MKQYAIDQLHPADYLKLKTRLDERHAVDGFEGLYHLFLADELLTPLQQAHQECQPYYFALELLADRLECELLVRSRQRISCQCIAYATVEQRNWLIRTIDAVLDDIGVIN